MYLIQQKVKFKVGKLLIKDEECEGGSIFWYFFSFVVLCGWDRDDNNQEIISKLYKY
jgi:hypothetical protein